MSRPISLANGSMLIGLDRYGLVHDFYYPYVGMENHANARGMRHRIGVYVDDQFSWLDDGSWQVDLSLEEEAMMGRVSAVNDHLELALEFTDFVDFNYNVLCRNVHVLNKSDRNREVRLFFHQVFRISDSNRGDTALYVPEDHYILDYKGRCSFLIYAEKADGTPFDQYSIGIHGIEGKEGTYRDAEDGVLEGHPVEHGSVDSTVRLTCNLSALSSERVHYWVAAAGSHDDALKVHQLLVGDGFTDRQEKTQQAWSEWLTTAKNNNLKFENNNLKQRFNQSLFIIKSHIDRRGSILASGDSTMLNYARDNYSYCWPRDAAYVLWPLIRLGYSEEPRAFFEFARDVLTERGALMHKFQPDRAVGSTWHPLVHKGKPELAIQEDETGIVLFMLHQYLQYSKDEDFVRRVYSSLTQPSANFLENFIDKSTGLPHASYDLWEEKFLTSAYTTATVYAGLMAASKMAEQFEYPDDSVRWQAAAAELKRAAQKKFFNADKQYFYKGFLLDADASKELEYDSTIDTSSLYGAVMFGLYPLDHEHISVSLKTLETELLNSAPVGGVPRYENDQYCRPEHDDPHNGNPWFVTTLWLAQIYIELRRLDDAKKLIDWTLSHTLSTGVLSEQINPETGDPLSVAPLIWSSAELVSTIIDIAEEES